jgi:hypothetical protein
MGPFTESKGNFSADLNSGPGRSPNIWSDCPWDAVTHGVIPGYFLDYNFGNLKVAADVAAADAYWTDGWHVFGSTGCALSVSADPTALSNAFGFATIGSDGDNEGGAIRQNNARFKMTGVNATASSRSGKLWLEWRCKTSHIDNTKHGIFSGLRENTAASATVPIAADGTLANENFVGFHRLEGDGDYFNAVYKADGVTQITALEDAQVIAADTWVKLGLTYNPTDPYSSTGASCRFYGNGLQVAQVAVPVAASAGAGAFPNDVLLGFIFAVLNATASTPGTSSINWVRGCQIAY